ncbi:MAG TPA: chloride channel protein [Streptosporangiaceae bacterium]|nr:chloride channel protein [Streptosporangiaceae bacterium]
MLAALLGVPISVIAWAFLAVDSQLQHWLYIALPAELGLHTVPVWWPFPMLAISGVLTASAIRFLPGTGGHSPADGLQTGSHPAASEIPGVVLAALATLGFGAVLGPEAPLIALGGGLGAWAVSRVRAANAEQVQSVLAATGSFASVSTLLGSPIVGAFLLMEAGGLGGPTMELVLVPGLLASGIGALVFIGLGHWTGLGTFSLAIPGLPHVGHPTPAEFGYAIVIGLAGAVLSVGIHRGALALRGVVQRQALLWTPVVGLFVAGTAVLFSQVTGKGTNKVLFSGQTALGPFVLHTAAYSLGALLLLLAMKALAYSASLSSFRGGPIFPSIFVGAVGGAALSHLPGLPLVAAVGMGIGAMTAGMLRLPFTAVLLACLMLFSDGVAIMPLVIVAVVTSYVTVLRLDPPAEAAGSSAKPAPAPEPAPDPAPAA